MNHRFLRDAGFTRMPIEVLATHSCRLLPQYEVFLSGIVRKHFTTCSVDQELPPEPHLASLLLESPENKSAARHSPAKEQESPL